MEYTHTLERVDSADGHTIYVVRSVPLEDAAVVWGREVLTIRMTTSSSSTASTTNGERVKTLSTLEIADMDGRTTAVRQRMTKAFEPEEWTEIRIRSVEYDVELGDSVFTLSNLRNPRN